MCPFEVDEDVDAARADLSRRSLIGMAADIDQGSKLCVIEFLFLLGKRVRVVEQRDLKPLLVTQLENMLQELHRRVSRPEVGGDVADADLPLPCVGSLRRVSAWSAGSASVSWIASLLIASSPHQ